MNTSDAVYMTNVTAFDNRGISQRRDTDERINQSAMIIAAALDCIQSPTSRVDPYALMNIRRENVLGNLEPGNYNPYGGVPAQELLSPPIKDIIRLKTCVLYPPNPNAPLPTTRERPLGCKTIFVDGLPDKITDEIIKEIFARCGVIETIRRRARRNFCDIRFSDELCIDRALLFSGYLVKIENRDDPQFTGRLHIDYAKNRDDERDYEIKQRSLQRQIRHQEADEKKAVRPLIFYPEQVSVICDMLKEEDSFTVAASSLITWLEKGECNRKTSSYFFSMIQSSYKQIKRLQLDKVKYENELNEAVRQLQFEKIRYENQLNQAMRSLQFEKVKCKDQLNQTKQMLNFRGRKAKLTGIMHQFNEIEKIYTAASLQKCWDHFSKPQRKNIETWKKQIEELKNNFKDEVIDVGDEEITLNNEIDAYSMDMYVQQLKDQHNADTQKLIQEVESLKSQLNIAQNEVISKSEELKKDKAEIESLKSQLKAAQNALKTQSELLKQKLAEIEQIKNQFAEEKNKMQGENLILNNKCFKYEADLKQLGEQCSSAQNQIQLQTEQLKQKDAQIEQMKKAFEEDISKMQEEKLGLNCKIFMYEAELKEYHEYKRKKVKGKIDSDYENNSHSRSSSNVNLLKDARLIGLISSFLHMHPGGADIDYICSYLLEMDPSIDSRDIENLLERYPAFFKEKSRGSGSKLYRKWYFTGF